IQDDPNAASALAQLRTVSLIEADSGGAEPSSEGTRLTPDVALPVPRYGETGLIFRQPFHYAWSWHDQFGVPPSKPFLIRDLGFARLDARSGSVEGGASRFVAAHGGFGVTVTTDRPASVGAWAICEQVLNIFQMKTFGFGANATTEAGLEITALKDGTELV